MLIKNNGFTLIELLFMITILAILCIISAPSLETLFNQYHYRQDVLRLFHTLQFARIEAIKRQYHVALCPSDLLTHCDTDTWSKGYIVYIATDKNNFDLKNILRVQKNSHTTSIHSPSLHAIEFTKEGRCLSRGSLYMESKDKKQLQRIVLYDSGRARIDNVLQKQ